MRRDIRQSMAISVVLLLLSAFFIAFAAANLANWRPVSGDEVWTIFTAEKLANEGRLGNELFRGFHNADAHYFFGLPVHPLLHALMFRIAEPGIAEARWVSMIAALVTLFAISWLALRWFGLRAALCTALLFVLWRNNLTHQDSGMPLLGAARSARWDMTPLPFMWLAVLAFDSLRRKPHWISACAAGLLIGLAAQTHFFGVFVAIGLALAWLWPGGETTMPGRRHALTVTLAACVSLLPFLVFVLQHHADAIAQFKAVHAARIGFTDMATLPGRLLDEWRRYAPVVARDGLGNWVLLLAAGPVAVYLAYLAFRRDDFGARVVCFCSLGILGGLAVIDTTKAPVYAVALLPPICLAFGKTVADSLPARLPVAWSPRIAASAVVAVLFALLLIEGLAAYRIDRQRGQAITPYAELGASINAEITGAGVVAGPVRWAWALRDQDYLSIDNLALQWVDAKNHGQPAGFAELLAKHSVRHLIISEHSSFGIEGSWPAALGAQIRDFVSLCSSRVAVWQDRHYGRIELFAIAPRRPGCG